VRYSRAGKGGVGARVRFCTAAVAPEAAACGVHARAGGIRDRMGHSCLDRTRRSPRGALLVRTVGQDATALPLPESSVDLRLSRLPFFAGEDSHSGRKRDPQQDPYAGGDQTVAAAVLARVGGAWLSVRGMGRPVPVRPRRSGTRRVPPLGSNEIASRTSWRQSSSLPVGGNTAWMRR